MKQARMSPSFELIHDPIYWYKAVQAVICFAWSS